MNAVDRRSDMEIALEQVLERTNRNQKLMVLYGAMMTVVREMLAARALNQDVTPFLDRLEAFHTREIQVREGLV